jgi:hypothetical protein
MGSACYSGGIHNEMTYHFGDMKENPAGGQTSSQN